MNLRMLPTLATAAALLLLLSGCEKGPIGIFASIEQEELIKKGNLSENAAVVGMVRDGNTYYAALGGGVYYRDAQSTGSDIDWDGPIDHPADFGDYAKVTDMVLVEFSNTIYVSYVTDNGDKYGLFALNTGDRSWSSNLYSDEQITRLHAIDGNDDGTTDELFASVGTSSYSLIFDPGGAEAGSEAVVVSGTSSPIIDGTKFGAGNYYFISKALVFTGNAPGSISAGPSPEDVWGADFSGVTSLGGILYDRPNDNVYVSVPNDGEVYYSADGGTNWSSASVPDSGTPTDFAFFPELDGTAGGVVVGVTVEGDSPGGYMEIPADAVGDGTLGSGDIEEPAGNNYISAAISDAAVLEFFVDIGPDPDRLFALTGGTGLWRARYADDDGNPQEEPFWSWE